MRLPVPLVRIPERVAAFVKLVSSERVTGRPELAEAETATLVRSLSALVLASDPKLTVWLALAIASVALALPE